MPPREAITLAEAQSLLFLDDKLPVGTCVEGDETARIHCLIARRYETDPQAQKLAFGLFDAQGSVAGLDVEQDMDGGYRGQLHLVPELPVGPRRKHLGWVAQSMTEIDAFLTALRAHAPSPVRYRHKALAFRFFRSVHARTPSAYANGFSISYNVDGSLLGSEQGVKETLFHEIFHSNDAAHGDWSARVLAPIFDAIVARCGKRTDCLRPYAPNDTMVRGGTYYSFQPGNGVHEYAAELAVRFYRELDPTARPRPSEKLPFRCGPAENKQAWDAIRVELFGGAESPRACP